MPLCRKLGIPAKKGLGNNVGYSNFVVVVIEAVESYKNQPRIWKYFGLCPPSPLPDCEDWCCSAHYSTIHRVRGRGIDSCKFSTFCFLFNIENQTCPDPWEWRKLGLLWPKFKNVMLSIWRCYIHLRCYHQRGWSLLLFWTFGLRSL